MLHFQENGSTMPTAGTAPERPVHSFRRSWDLPGFIHSFRKSVMLHLSRLVYNDIQKVTAKGRLTRHFPDGNPEQDPLEGRKGLNGRKMPLQTLWRTWPENSPSEGETISRGNCTPSEGGKGRNGRKMPLQTLWRTSPDDSPSEGETISRGNCTPSEGGNGLNGRKTPLQTLWRTWPRNSPSEGGTISRGNCAPSEGGKVGGGRTAT